MIYETKRKMYDILRGDLINERQSFEPTWRDLGDYFMPRRPRWQTTDANRGDRGSKKILDTTPVLAVRTLSAGMMAGVTSPARPWFRLATQYPELNEYGPVKTWLHEVTQALSTIFLRSNLYQKLPLMYDSLGVFGTGALGIEEDFETVVRFYDFPIGSYYLANSERYKPEVWFREFRMTIRQLVATFGKTDKRGEIDWSRFSDTVRTDYMANRRETWIDVCHVILPNEEYDENKLGSKYLKYSSCYYEKGSTNQDRYLRESGYSHFPILAARWETSGEDVYATSSPGMIALPDNKQLQKGESRALQAIDRMANPPMKAPASLKTLKVSTLPGDVTWVPDNLTGVNFEPVYQLNPRIQELEIKQDQVRRRVDRAFFVDLFLMLQYGDPQRGKQPVTAAEIAVRESEKLLALGSMLENLNQDVLDPLIDNTFNIALKQGQLPEPPEELAGMRLKVEYISVMAQAQKLMGRTGIDHFIGFVMNMVAQTKDPTILDKVDLDQTIDEYGEIMGVPPRIVRPDEEVADIRAQRQQANQAAQEAEAVAMGAKAAKDMSQTKMDEDSMMTRLLKAAEAGRIPA